MSVATLDRRRSGVLLHLSSLPGSLYRGVLTEAAYRFIDLLADSGFTVWQVLPVGPTGDDGSPYFSVSAHAGNPRFIDRSSNLIYGRRSGEYTAFVESHPWLLDDALFFAIKAEQGGRGWWEWPSGLRDRDAAVLNHARTRHRDAVERFMQEQFAFDRQWQALRQHAHARGIKIFGDLPIYMAHDSAEVWAHRDDYQLDMHGRPTAVSGVPPDYFAQDGQLWGNPLYAWAHLENGGFASWVARMRTQLERFDLVRIDHFRGLEAYWSVPADAVTARDGRWVKAPGDVLLQKFQEVFGRLPLVAEDLGLITPEVTELRDHFRLPGMRVLQFAFDGSQDNPHLPRNHVPNCVVYTGTHDNDTTVGWARGLDEHTARVAQDVLSCARHEIPDAMNGAALASVANLAMLPMQDLLGLDSQTRMNTPGTTVGNWTWSFDWEQIPGDFTQRWLQHNQGYGRSG